MSRFSPGTARRLAILVLLISLSVVMVLGESLQVSAEVPPAQDDPGAQEGLGQSEVSTLKYRRGKFRDPFRSLEDQGLGERGPRPPGPAGMLIEEIDLVGVLTGPKGSMVLIIGSDGLGYSLQEGSPLYDGKVLRINDDVGLVIFRQDVNDPNRIKPYRDIERRIESAS